MLPLIFFEPQNLFLHAAIGSGKTTTLLIAMGSILDISVQRIQCVFFGSTIESVLQSETVFASIAKHTLIKTSIVHWNSHRFDSNAQVVFGTPLELTKKLKSLNASDLSEIKLICCDDADITINFSEVKSLISDLNNRTDAKLLATSSTYMSIDDIMEFKVPRRAILKNNIRHVYIKTECWSHKVDSILELANQIDGQMIVFCAVMITFFNINIFLKI